MAGSIRLFPQRQADAVTMPKLASHVNPGYSPTLRISNFS